MGLIHTFQSAHNKAKQQAPSKWLHTSFESFWIWQLSCLYNSKLLHNVQIPLISMLIQFFFLGGGLIEFKNTTCLLISWGPFYTTLPFHTLLLLWICFSQMCKTGPVCVIRCTLLWLICFQLFFAWFFFSQSSWNTNV